jgi:hypothetical protein
LPLEFCDIPPHILCGGILQQVGEIVKMDETGTTASAKSEVAVETAATILKAALRRQAWGVCCCDL